MTRLVPVATRGWRWTYEGTPPIQLTVYRMPSQTSAFAAVQDWRPAAGQLAFYKDRYYGIAESAGAGIRTLTRFVAAVQTALPEG